MKKNKYLAGLLIVFFISCNPLAAYAFSDTRQHWARPQIDHLQNRSLINGYPDGTYGPDRYISRAEFVTLVINVLNKSAEAKQLFKGQSHFADTSDHWARGYIELARELDIVHGDGKGYFNPLTSISREEAVTMLVSSLGVTLKDLPPVEFSDSIAISSWAQKSIDYAVNKGLVHGYPDNSFKPGQYLTRAEVAVLLEQFLALQGQEFHFYGTLEQIDLPLKRATVTINGRKEVFELSANVVGYREGQSQPLGQIDLPTNAYFSLNADGKLAYFYISEKSSGIRLDLRSMALPNQETILPAEGNIVKLTEELDTKKIPSLASNRPEISLATTAEAMRVPQFSAQTGASGRGQLVAIIDSGIDPGHPDLQTTSEGYRKIVDFIDLSDEGKLSLTSVKAQNGYLNIDNKKVDVSNIKNQADEFKYGYFDLNFLPANFSLGDQQLLIVAAARKNHNTFDTIYVDSDFDGQISDQTPIREYSRQGETVVIPGEGKTSFNLLLAEIAPDGSYIKLGFDMLGHGTEVSGIVAARGKIKGIAPDAQLLPIKVMDRSGTTSLKKIENALSLAAQRGAKIAVVSIGQYQVKKSEMESLAKVLANVHKVSGMLVCMAAGNNGPGLGTVVGTASVDNIISVGAYATPEMWNADYGWWVEKPTLWYFSSIGPAADGSAAPLLLAPGNAVSTYPLWTGQPYQLDQGSSIAAPHLAGAAALLLDASNHKLYVNDGSVIGRALLAGAEPLPGFQAVEQGLGTVNLIRAWNELQKISAKETALTGKQYSPGLGSSRGLYSRGWSPGELSLQITNNGNENEQLSVGGLASWVKPKQYTVQVPAHSQRSIDIEYDELQEPGLYSTFLMADKFSTPEWDLAMLQTVVVPYNLAGIGKKGFEESAELLAGQFKRYFFQVPETMTSLDFKLLSGDKGRVQMHVVSPQGKQEVSQYAGVGDAQVTASVNMHYNQPVPGIWEVVVYSSATLSEYNLKESQFTLMAIPDIKGTIPASPADNKYLITAVPPEFKPGEKNYVTLYFWYRENKLPAAGLVTINGRLYEIKNGMVKLEVEPQQGQLNLNVAW